MNHQERYVDLRLQVPRCRRRGFKLFRQIEGTSTDVHDSQAAAALIQGDVQAYYADKGYDSDELRRSLKDRGIEPCLIYTVHRNTALTTATLLNSLFSGPRNAVERSFAPMKRHHGLARVRYFGLRRITPTSNSPPSRST